MRENIGLDKNLMKYYYTVFHYTLIIFILFENWMKWAELKAVVPRNEQYHIRKMPMLSKTSQQTPVRVEVNCLWVRILTIKSVWKNRSTWNLPWEARTCWAYSCLKFKVNSRWILYKKISTIPGWIWQTVEDSPKCYCIQYFFVCKIVTVSLRPCRTQMNIYIIYYIYLYRWHMHVYKFQSGTFIVPLYKFYLV